MDAVRLFQTLLRAARAFSRKHIGIYRYKLLIGLLCWPLLALTRGLSALIPRRPGLVAFGCNSNRFADNSAYAFLEAAREPRLRAVWITGDRDLARRLADDGFDARYRWSSGGLIVAARASCYVYSYMVSDVNRWLSGGTTTFQLWHGVGFGKRVLRDRGTPWHRVHTAPARSLIGCAFVEERHIPDWLLTTSASATRDAIGTFGVPPERCAELGYPRNDHLVAGVAPPSPLFDDAVYEHLRQADFVVGYFPTWRPDSRSAVPVGMPDLNKLGERLHAQGVTLLVKGHHAQAAVSAGGSLLCVLPSDADLSAYLGLCDVLVTDSSSVSSDFALLDRPILIYVPDYDDVMTADLLLADPREHAPGIFVESAAELHEILADARSVPRAANLDELVPLVWHCVDPHAASRLVDFIRDRVTSVASKANNGE